MTVTRSVAKKLRTRLFNLFYMNDNLMHYMETFLHFSDVYFFHFAIANHDRYWYFSGIPLLSILQNGYTNQLKYWLRAPKNFSELTFIGKRAVTATSQGGWRLSDRFCRYLAEKATVSGIELTLQQFDVSSQGLYQLMRRLFKLKPRTSTLLRAIEFISSIPMAQPIRIEAPEEFPMLGWTLKAIAFEIDDAYIDYKDLVGGPKIAPIYFNTVLAVSKFLQARHAWLRQNLSCSQLPCALDSNGYCMRSRSLNSSLRSIYKLNTAINNSAQTSS